MVKQLKVSETIRFPFVLRVQVYVDVLIFSSIFSFVSVASLSLSFVLSVYFFFF